MAVVATLGQLSFECSSNKVFTFDNLNRSNSARWQKHDVIGGKPQMEYIGEDSSKVSLTIRYDAFIGVTPQKGFERLKKMLENKKYKTLIVGGEYLGRYVIESIEEERQKHTGQGQCLIARATVNLTEYGK